MVGVKSAESGKLDDIREIDDGSDSTAEYIKENGCYGKVEEYRKKQL